MNKICPICDFQNINVGRVCLNCGSLERQRVFSYISQKNKINFSDKKILIVAGSEPEYILLKKLGANEIDRIDIRQNKLNKYTGDICDLSGKILNESYDIIFASFVLTTTYDTDAALSEFHRILKNDGLLITCDPLKNDYSNEFLDINKIIQWYGLDNYIDYRIGEFRELGVKTFLIQLSSLYRSELVEEKDNFTGKIIKWIISKKIDSIKKFLPRKLDLPQVYIVPGISYEMQKLEGFRPRSNLKHWPIDKKILWDSNPFNDNNWVFQLQAWRILDPILREWLIKREEGLLFEVIEIIFDWDDFYKINEDGRTVVWADMTAGIRALKLAFILDLISSGHLNVSDSILTRIKSIAHNHVEFLKNPEKLANSNHGYFQIFGLHRLVDFVDISFEEKNDINKFIIIGLNTLIHKHFTTEGVHKEHSPEYHIFVINILNSLGIRKVLQDDLINNLIKKASSIVANFVFPDCSISEIGDTSPAIISLNSNESKDVDYIELNKGIYSNVIDLHKSGYLIIKSKNSKSVDYEEMLIMTGNYYSHVHKHNDDLSFEFYFNNKKIFVDSGKYSYNIDETRKYIVSGLAHNTITTVQNNFNINLFKPYGSCLNKISILNNCFLLSGQVDWPKFYFHSRDMFYSPSECLIIKDTINNNFNNLDIVNSLNINPKCKVEKIGTQIIIDENIIIESNSDVISIDSGYRTISYGNVEKIPRIYTQCSDVSHVFLWKISFL